MRALVQRVTEASVSWPTGRSAIGPGLVVLLGVRRGDAESDAAWAARKCLNLRIFSGPDGRMTHSVEEIGGALLVVSQFTLHADCRKGRRPSFELAAEPKTAEHLYEHFVGCVSSGSCDVRTGSFGAAMAVSLVNDGPVTILLDSRESGNEERE